MVTILQAIVLGILQGITEWLPISSSAHLVLAEYFFGIEVSLLFNIALHFGTLIVILLVFQKEIIAMIKALVKREWSSPHAKLAGYIVVGSIPTGLIGFFFRDVFASFFRSLRVVGIALLVTGGLLLISERKLGKKKLNWVDGILIGIAQGIAIIPGISRSGSTISIGLLRGIERHQAAVFSFLLAVPVIIGASISEFDLATVNAELWPMLIGTLTAVIVGYFSLRLLLKIIHNKQFHLFAYYCFIVGIAILVYTAY